MPAPSQHGPYRQHGGRDDPSRVPVRPVPLCGRAGQRRGHAEAAGQTLSPLTHQLVLFHLNTGRAAGASRFIHRLVVRTSQS